MSSRVDTLPGLRLVATKVWADARGGFVEVWQRERHGCEGLPREWAQDNVSWSRRGVLRGLHLQLPRAQGKLVTVLRGEVFDVAVDLRAGSPAFGCWAGFVLSDEDSRQLYLPPGCAHGFLVRSDEAVVTYKCTERYYPADEVTVRWDDPELAIDWGVREPPLLSAKDSSGVVLRDLPRGRLLRFDGIGAGG